MAQEQNQPWMKWEVKSRVLKSLPPLIQNILPAGITYDVTSERFRSDDGQFVSADVVKDQSITRVSAQNLSDSISRLEYQFNRSYAYSYNISTAKKYEFAAQSDATREASLEAGTTQLSSLSNVDTGRLSDLVDRIAGNVTNQQTNIINTAVGAVAGLVSLAIAAYMLMPSKAQAAEPTLGTGLTALMASEYEDESGRRKRRKPKPGEPGYEKQPEAPTVDDTTTPVDTELYTSSEKYAEAKAIAESYLGRAMPDDEFALLIKGVVNESGRGDREDALIAAGILNRTGAKYRSDGTVRGTLYRKGQFQPFTGGPVEGYYDHSREATPPEIARVIRNLINNLQGTPVYFGFTAYNIKAYGKYWNKPNIRKFYYDALAQVANGQGEIVGNGINKTIFFLADEGGALSRRQKQMQGAPIAQPPKPAADVLSANLIRSMPSGSRISYSQQFAKEKKPRPMYLQRSGDNAWALYGGPTGVRKITEADLAALVQEIQGQKNLKLYASGREIRLYRSAAEKLAQQAANPPGQRQQQPPTPVASGDLIMTGDSIAWGLAGYLKKSQRYSHIGWSPAKVLGLMRSTLKPSDIRGKTVVISSGASNDSTMSQKESISAQIQFCLQHKPARIVLLGVFERYRGTYRGRPISFAGINAQLARIAQQNNIEFTNELELYGKPGSDGYHPTSTGYAAMYAAIKAGRYPKSVASIELTKNEQFAALELNKISIENNIILRQQIQSASEDQVMTADASMSINNFKQAFMPNQIPKAPNGAAAPATGTMGTRADYLRILGYG